MFDFLTNKFSSLFASLLGSGKLTEKDIDATLHSVKQSLLEADVSYELVEAFMQDLKKEMVGKKVFTALKPAEQLVKIVHDQLKMFLGGAQQNVPFSFQIPSVTMVMGLQGSGKTTSLGKIAAWIHKDAQAKKKERRILLASVDFYRPAAVDQLEIVAKQAGVSFYRSHYHEPLKAVRDIYDHFKQGLYELLLLDTAGRLHIDNTLLKELRDIDSYLNPKYKLLVLDAMTGQESLTVARSFEQGVGFDIGLMSKMDSDTRGGAAFSFRYALKKPIVFVGVGEKVDDLELFHPERMAGRILGMGDMVSLAEKAQEKIKQSEQEAAYKAFSQGQFTLQDFADQLAMMNKLGSFSQVAKYLPAMGGQTLSSDMLEKGERELKKFKAIMSSMTLKERLNPHILEASRKKRIALGAGVTPDDINILLQRFEQSKQYVKLFKKFGRFNTFFK